MPWVRYDDRFPNHRKVVDVKAVDRTALTLHLLCGTWSASSDAPGLVSEAATIEQAGGKARAKRWARILVDARLWHAPGHDCPRCPQIDKGYVIHDWPDWNAYKEISRKRAEAGRKGAAARWGNGTSDGKVMASAMPMDDPHVGNAEITDEQSESNSKISGRSGPGELRRPDSAPTSDDANEGDSNSHGNRAGNSTGKKWPDPDPDPDVNGSVGDPPPRRNPGGKAEGEDSNSSERRLAEPHTGPLRSGDSSEQRAEPAQPRAEPLAGGSAESRADIEPLDALIAEVKAIRPEWSTRSIERALTRPSVAERPRHIVRSAALAVAHDRTSTAPGRLEHDGPWWRLPEPPKPAPAVRPEIWDDTPPLGQRDYGDTIRRGRAAVEAEIAKARGSTGGDP